MAGMIGPIKVDVDVVDEVKEIREMVGELRAFKTLLTNPNVANSTEAVAAINKRLDEIERQLDGAGNPGKPTASEICPECKVDVSGNVQPCGFVGCPYPLSYFSGK